MGFNGSTHICLFGQELSWVFSCSLATGRKSPSHSLPEYPFTLFVRVCTRLVSLSLFQINFAMAHR